MTNTIKLESQILRDAHQKLGVQPKEVPGIIRVKELNPSDYYADDRLSQSLLKAFIACPNYYKWRYIDRKEEPLTDALLFGKAVDCLVTTPELFDSVFDQSPRRTDGNFVDGKYILTPTQYQSAKTTAEKVLRQPVMIELFNTWEKQKVLVDDKRKGMLDFFHIDEKKSRGYIADLKTCKNILDIENSMFTYGYYFQMAFYRLLAKQLYPHIKKWTLYIIAIDKTPNKQFCVFEIDQRKFKGEENLIIQATDGLKYNVRMSTGLCKKCPPEVACQYALFKQKHIKRL